MPAEEMPRQPRTRDRQADGRSIAQPARGFGRWLDHLSTDRARRTNFKSRLREVSMTGERRVIHAACHRHSVGVTVIDIWRAGVPPSLHVGLVGAAETIAVGTRAIPVGPLVYRQTDTDNGSGAQSGPGWDVRPRSCLAL